MPARLLALLLLSSILLNCGAGDKRLPSSNPPEYDPTKVYAGPAAPPAQSTPEPAIALPAEDPDLVLLPLDPAANEKGEWRKLKSDALQPRKGAKSICEALTQLQQGLGSTQVFGGRDGQALRQALGPEADSVGRMLDRQLADGLKEAFGPNATACPGPTTAPRRGRIDDRTDAPRVLPASTRPVFLAQAAPDGASEDGYTETKTEDKQNPPPGWIGWKKINRTSRVGSKPETAGNRKTTTLILGVKARHCPDSAGIVPGDFEHAMIFFQATHGGQRTVHIGQRVHATLKGHIGDDGKLQYIEADAVVVIMRGGSGLASSMRRAHYVFRFTPDRNVPVLPTNLVQQVAEAWNFEDAEPADIDLTQTLLASVMAYAGPNMLQAETKWSDPKTGCAEIRFTPATTQQRVGRGQSAKVRAQVFAKENPAAVPGQFKYAFVVPERVGGQVSPTQIDTKPDTVAQFTYTAPTKTVRHRGFNTGAISRAGAAEGQWEAADISYVLEFRSTVIGKDDIEPAQSQASGTIRLEPQAGAPAGSEPKYVGQGPIAYQTGPLPNWDVCKPLVRGQGHVPMQVYQAFIHIDESASGPSAKGSAKIEIVYALLDLSAETTTGWAYYLNFKCVPNPAEYHPYWSVMYVEGRGEAGATPEKMWTLKDWTYVGQNGVVATKTLRSTCNSLCVEEVATFTLKEAD